MLKGKDRRKKRITKLGLHVDFSAFGDQCLICGVVRVSKEILVLKRYLSLASQYPIILNDKELISFAKLKRTGKYGKGDRGDWTG